MTELYDSKEIDLLTAKQKRMKVLLIIVSGAFVLLAVLLCLLRTDENHTLLQTVATVVGVLYAWFMFGFIAVVYLPAGNFLRHLIKMRDCEKELEDCLFLAFDNGTITVNKLEFHILTVLCSGERTDYERQIYVRKDYAFPQIGKRTEIIVMVADSVLLAYGFASDGKRAEGQV